MWDLICIAASLVFFGLAHAYTAGCERLSAKAVSK
jgi:hypothetical protein